MKQTEIVLPLEYEEFVVEIRKKYPDCVVRIIMCNGVYKLADQHLHPNRVDIVMEDGKVTSILREPFVESEPESESDVEL